MQAEDEFEFSRLAYQAIVVEKRGELKDVADRMGMKYATLHARLNQRAHFRPGEIRTLLGVLPHQDLISYLIARTPYVLAARPDGDDGGRDVMTWSHESLFHVVDVLRQVRAALADGFIDHREKIPLLADIAEAETALASLKAAVAEAGDGHGARREKDEVGDEP